MIKKYVEQKMQSLQYICFKQLNRLPKPLIPKPLIPCCKYDATLAAINGHLRCLMLIHKHCGLDDGVLEILLQYNYTECVHFLILVTNCKSACTLAAKYNRLDILQHLHEKFILDDTVSDVALRSNSLECLKYCIDNGSDIPIRACAEAARLDYFEIFKYFIDMGYGLDAVSIAEIAYIGNVKCLKYAHLNGAQLDNRLCELIVINDNLRCLLYIHRNGVELTNTGIFTALENLSIKCLTYIMIVKFALILGMLLGALSALLLVSAMSNYFTEPLASILVLLVGFVLHGCHRLRLRVVF